MEFDFDAIILTPKHHAIDTKPRIGRAKVALTARRGAAHQK